MYAPSTTGTVVVVMSAVCHHTHTCMTQTLWAAFRCARRLCLCSLCSVCGLPLCSALVRMQLVQRMRLLQLVIVLAFLVTKNIKQRACVCHCAGGRGPRNRYRDTPLRHLRILGYCSACLLGYGSATGLVLLCVLLYALCVAFHLRTVIALRLVLVLFLFFVLLFSTDLAPLNRAFNPHILGLNYPNELTDLWPNQTNAPQNAPKMPAHCAQKCAQNTNTIRAPNTFENAFKCPPMLLTLASAAPPRTAAAPARPRSPQ